MATSTTAEMVSVSAVAFLLTGKVQKVKMRRYIESAGRHCGVGGYCVNTDDGFVFGEAWVCDDHRVPLLRNFQTWIQGQWEPVVFTNIKPTPVGTAYPELAVVEQCYVLNVSPCAISKDHFNRFSDFTMVRDDQESAMLQLERRHVVELFTAAAADGSSPAAAGNYSASIGIYAWPTKQ